MKVELNFEEFKVLYTFIGKLHVEEEDMIYNWNDECDSGCWLIYALLYKHYKNNSLSDNNIIDIALNDGAIGRFIEWLGHVDMCKFYIISDKNALWFTDKEYNTLYNAYKKLLTTFRTECDNK